MVQRVTLAAVGIGLCLVGAACGGGEKAEVETAESKAAATQSASAWSPEMKAKMQAALRNRRSDSGGPASGTK